MEGLMSDLFVLSEEQQMARQMAREFAEREILPAASRWDREGICPVDVLREMGGLGLMGMTVPVEHGGAGMDSVSYVLAMEEIARADAAVSVMMSVNNSLVCNVLDGWGTEEQKKVYLRPLASGEKLGCYCLSEPDAGSDASGQKTTALRRGDHYVLNGTKNFITNGDIADYGIVMAATDRSKGKKGISCFVVDMKSPGCRPGKREKKMGLHASPTTEVHFEDCRVPAGQRIGEEGEGFKIALATLDVGRIGIAAQAVGIARAALEASVKYAKDRKQFGRPIGEFQSIQWKLADLATEIDAARLLTWRAAAVRDRSLQGGDRFTQEAAMAKLFASEVCYRATDQAIQIHGGYGYVKDYPVEKLFRDGRVTQIYEGTSEIQRLVIARHLLQA
jgi:alkylation response protein AidB-like acyl-CoA dehydrogenase